VKLLNKAGRRRFQMRALAVLGFTVLWSLWLIWRVTDIQAVRASLFADMAQAEHIHVFTLTAQRGSILDRNGRVLAMDVPAYTVTASPRVISEMAKQLGQPLLALSEARLLAKVLPYSVGQLASALSGRSWYRLIDEYITPAQAHILMAEQSQLYGITLVPTERREYPNGSLAAQVVGFVNSQGQGVAGVEYADNKILAGQNGSWTVATTVNGLPLPAWTSHKVNPVPGDTVELTIDSTIERKVEQFLAADVRKFRAKDGVVIIMDPHTGAVLALANYPTFNPNDYWDYKTVDFTNWAVSDPIPPGSIFKPVTASAGLMDGVVQPTTMFDTVGYKIVDGVRINDWVPGGWGWISFTRGLELSSNQVFMDVGLKLGVARLYRMIKAYGFFHPSGIGLPGDSTGIFIPQSQVNAVDLATIAFGQGIAVTPMQELTMISAIANNGVLLKPRIRRAILSPTGQVLKRFGPVVEGRPITPYVAYELHVMMEREVGYGTGVYAQVKGYTWAGKTGTAQQIVNGVTSNTVYVSSYVGYGPMPDPRFAMLVMVNDPQANIYGGTVSAPVWGQIAAWLMKYWHIPPYVHNNLPNGVPQGNSIPPPP
jgi:stage V sporulation protein D (sporulation-specific penicillin-binding protein)